MPILLAVSPLAATLSAPTTTASTLPAAISEAAAESAMSVPGRLSWTNSYAVKRAPVSVQSVQSKLVHTKDSRQNVVKGY